MTFSLTPETKFPESKLPELGIWTTEQLYKAISERQSDAGSTEEEQSAERDVRKQYASQFALAIRARSFTPTD